MLRNNTPKFVYFTYQNFRTIATMYFVEDKSFKTCGTFLINSRNLGGSTKTYLWQILFLYAPKYHQTIIKKETASKRFCKSMRHHPSMFLFLICTGFWYLLSYYSCFEEEKVVTFSFQPTRNLQVYKLN